MDASSAVTTIMGDYASVEQWQTEIYLDLHRNPELSMQEVRTRGVIARELETLGYRVDKIGGGLVGTLDNGPGATVMLRADFDALPVREETGLDYASTATAVNPEGKTVPVMHACGHDCHVASLLAMGALMMRHREQWSGRLQLLFQPGEETGEGSKSMVADGLVERVDKPDVVLGQHVFCGPVPAGQVGVVPGPFMSTAVNVDITLHGRGSHGSMPHLGVDPIVLAAHVVQRLQTIVARELSPHEFGVVTVGVVEAGTRPNVIPETARLKLNVRAYDEAVRARILAAIERITRGEAVAAGAPREPEFRYYESFPVTDNDDVVASRLTASFGRDLGEKNVHRIEPLTASEDFSVLADAFGAPYCFWLLGGAPEGVSIPNHSPKFAPVLQPTLATGTRALVSAACEYLR